LDDSRGACFSTQLHSCFGACTGKENADLYNLRVNSGISSFKYRSPDFFIIDQGRSQNEHAVVKIEKGRYIGFGFLSEDSGYIDLESLHDCIKPYQDNRDIQYIIRGSINRRKGLKIIDFTTD